MARSGLVLSEATGGNFQARLCRPASGHVTFFCGLGHGSLGCAGSWTLECSGLWVWGLGIPGVGLWRLEI